MTASSDRDRFRKLVTSARVIIFDFDGVLADSEKYHFAAYRDVFAKYGHAVDEVEYYKYWTSLGHGARGEIERHNLDLDPLAIREEKRPTFSGYCRDGSIRLFPEAIEIVSRLSAAGKILTIASGSERADIDAILENGGVQGAFKHIIGSDTVPTIKPAPDIFLAMLDAVAAEPYECVVFEDAEKGVQAAIASDIPVIAIHTPETSSIDFSLADVVFASHAEFLQCVRSTFPD